MGKNQKLSIVFLLTSKLLEKIAFFTLTFGIFQLLMPLVNYESANALIIRNVAFTSLTITAIFAGWIGDFTNRTRLVGIGFILMAIGYLSLNLIPCNTIIITILMALIGIGSGLTATNYIVFLGNIFKDKNNEFRGLVGFVLYGIVIAFSAWFSHILFNTTENFLGINASIFLSLILVIGAIVLYFFFTKHYSKIDFNDDKEEIKPDIEANKKLHKKILFITLAILGIFTLAISQNGFRIAEHLFELELFDLQRLLTDSHNLISIIAASLFFIVIILAKKFNWKKIFNILILSSLLGVISYILIALSTPTSDILRTKFFVSTGFILFIIANITIKPTIDYIVFKSSPKKLKGLFQGIIYAISSVITLIALLGIRIFEVNPVLFFLLMAIILLACIVWIFFFNKKNLSNDIEI